MLTRSDGNGVGCWRRDSLLRVDHHSRRDVTPKGALGHVHCGNLHSPLLAHWRSHASKGALIAATRLQSCPFESGVSCFGPLGAHDPVGQGRGGHIGGVSTTWGRGLHTALDGDGRSEPIGPRVAFGVQSLGRHRHRRAIPVLGKTDVLMRTPSRSAAGAHLGRVVIRWGWSSHAVPGGRHLSRLHVRSASVSGIGVLGCSPVQRDAGVQRRPVDGVLASD